MLRGLLEVVRLEPQSQEETSDLALAFVQRLANEADLAGRARSACRSRSARRASI